VALFAAHRLSLVRLAVLLVDDLGTAEDVVQDAFAGFVGRSRPLNDPDRRWPTCAPRSSTTPGRRCAAVAPPARTSSRATSSRTARTAG